MEFKNIDDINNEIDDKIQEWNYTFQEIREKEGLLKRLSEEIRDLEVIQRTYRGDY